MEKYKEGLEFFKNNDVENAEKAFSESTVADAKFQLGLIQISKNEVVKGVSNLELAANDGSILASKTLLTIYEKGMGVEANHDKASFYARLYIKSNEEGAKDLIESIALAHKEDKPVYLKYLQALCDIGDITAIYEAALIILNDAKDSVKGIEYLQKAVSLGSKDAMVKLAEIYKEGLYNTKVNGDGYIDLITKLSNDYPEEIKYTDMLVEVYEKGLFGVAKDNEKAVQILREKASHDYAESIYEYRLAECRETGRLGIRVDTKEAINAYQSLLDSYPNNPTYMLKMAEIYEEGKFGVTRDLKKAYQIYRSLVAKNPDVLEYKYRLAVAYSKSTEASEQKEAYEIFDEAFEAGIREAGYYVVKLNYEGGTRYPKDYLKAVTAANKLTQIVGNANLSDKEKEDFRMIKSLEIQMYENGGAKLPKNPRKAKEILEEYNNTHDVKININAKKIKWN